MSFIIRHIARKCISYNQATGQFVIKDFCDKYQMVNGNHLKHLPSGQCIKPDGPQSYLVLASNCTSPETVFEQTTTYQIMHKATGLQIHQQGGSADPSVDTPVHLSTDVGDRAYIRFRMYDEGMLCTIKLYIKNCHHIFRPS